MQKNQSKLIQCPYCPSFGEVRGFPIHMKLAHPNGGDKVLYPDAMRELNQIMAAQS